jgi:glyoxylase-like metal-dependent hydrolase (beta-lactamase superfamily II)
MEFKILIEGYARKQNDILFASPTTLIIRDNGLNILIDPGANRQLLLNALYREGVTIEDIDIIFLTHYHLDHILNIRLFPDKDIYDGSSINSNDKITPYSGNIPNTNLEVLYTPGHTQEHWSLLIKTDKGMFAVAGDLFWWYDDEVQKLDEENLVTHGDPYAWDMETLYKNRKMLLSSADYVIPGHGKLFSTKMV